MTGRIHSLESFGTVDGPGIRFVVFFQGCPMRCKYCHNPDTWDIRGGREMSDTEILQKAASVREFLRGGGITATGGEPMLQLDFLTSLFCKAKKEYCFHTCLDTSGIVFDPQAPQRYDELLRFTDLVMLDIKHIDPKEHFELTAQPIDNVLTFARHLSARGIPLWIRHVLVPGITLNDEYLYRLGKFLGALNSLQAIDVLPYHDMGKVKYEALGLDYPLKDTRIPADEEVIAARTMIESGIRAALRSSRNEL